MDILFCRECADLRKITATGDFVYCQCGKNYAIKENDELRVSEDGIVFETDLTELLRNVNVFLELDIDNPPVPDTVMRIKAVSTFDRDVDLSEDDA